MRAWLKPAAAPGSSHLQTPEKGIALGNLSSQILANISLNEFGHWVKEVLRIKHYIRYVDDIVVLGSSAQELAHLQQRLAAKLAEIGLQSHPRKTVGAQKSQPPSNRRGSTQSARQRPSLQLRRSCSFFRTW